MIVENKHAIKKVRYDHVAAGEVFEDDGSLFIKADMKGISGRQCVRLDRGVTYSKDDDHLVTPVTGKFIRES